MSRRRRRHQWRKYQICFHKVRSIKASTWNDLDHEIALLIILITAVVTAVGTLHLSGSNHNDGGKAQRYEVVKLVNVTRFRCSAPLDRRSDSVLKPTEMSRQVCRENRSKRKTKQLIDHSDRAFLLYKIYYKSWSC